jgi:hypothetical protein
MQNIFETFMAACGWRRTVVFETPHKSRLEYRHVLFPVTVRLF